MKRAEIEQLLPGIFQRTVHPENPLTALLDVMECLHAPSERVLMELDARFDPRRAPEEFVPFLARWVDLERLFSGDESGRETSGRMRLSTGLGRFRELIAAAAELSKWRGTARGLRQFLETATGGKGFEIRENVSMDGRVMLYHLLVIAPADLEAHRSLIARIIESEKPAYVTCELVFEAISTR